MDERNSWRTDGRGLNTGWTEEREYDAGLHILVT